jgi:hypothetical protein
MLRLTPSTLEKVMRLGATIQKFLRSEAEPRKAEERIEPTLSDLPPG